MACCRREKIEIEKFLSLSVTSTAKQVATPVFKNISIIIPAYYVFLIVIWVNYYTAARIRMMQLRPWNAFIRWCRSTVFPYMHSKKHKRHPLKQDYVNRSTQNSLTSRWQKKCNLLHSKNTSFAELIRVNSPHKSLQLVTVRPKKCHTQKNIQRHCINEHI